MAVSNIEPAACHQYLSSPNPLKLVTLPVWSPQPVTKQYSQTVNALNRLPSPSPTTRDSSSGIHTAKIPPLVINETSLMKSPLYEPCSIGQTPKLLFPLRTATETPLLYQLPTSIPSQSPKPLKHGPVATVVIPLPPVAPRGATSCPASLSVAPLAGSRSWLGAPEAPPPAGC